MLSAMKYQGTLKNHINTQTYGLTGCLSSVYGWGKQTNEKGIEKGMEISRLIRKAYEAIHKYENFTGGTNRRSELNDRLDMVQNWVFMQWPDYYGVSGCSGYQGMSGFSGVSGYLGSGGMSGFSSAVGSLQSAFGGLGSSMAQAGAATQQAFAQAYKTYQADNSTKDSSFVIPRKPWSILIKMVQKLMWRLGLYEKT